MVKSGLLQNAFKCPFRNYAISCKVQQQPSTSHRPNRQVPTNRTILRSRCPELSLQVPNPTNPPALRFRSPVLRNLLPFDVVCSPLANCRGRLLTAVRDKFAVVLVVHAPFTPSGLGVVGGSGWEWVKDGRRWANCGHKSLES